MKMEFRFVQYNEKKETSKPFGIQVENYQVWTTMDLFQTLHTKAMNDVSILYTICHIYHYYIV